MIESIVGSHIIWLLRVYKNEEPHIIWKMIIRFKPIKAKTVNLFILQPVEGMEAYNNLSKVNQI